MENRIAWSNAVKGIWSAVLTIFILNCCAGLINGMGAFIPLISIIAGILSIISFVFLCIYAKRLNTWKMLTEKRDRENIGSIHTAAVLKIITSVCSFLMSFITTIAPLMNPIAMSSYSYESDYYYESYSSYEYGNDLMGLGYLSDEVTILIALFGFAAAIMGLVGFIMETSAFAGLKDSKTMPETARSGMRLLFTSNILLLICALTAIVVAVLCVVLAELYYEELIAIFCIFFGIVILGLGLASIITYLMGWSRVADSELPHTQEPQVAQERYEYNFDTTNNN